jgi:hypothetical protein
MTRTTLAIALATGALAVPAVALASGGAGDTAPSSTTPVQQQEQQPEQQQEQQPEQQPRQPRDQDRPGHPCPEDRGGGGSSDGSGSSETQL